MKNSISLRIYSTFFKRLLKKELPKPSDMKAIQQEYQVIRLRAKEIGENNPLLSAYVMAMYFIAMNRKDGLSPKENADIFEKGLKKSKMIRLTLGNSESYFSEKRIVQRKKWSARTKERKYENDWVVDILDANGDYDMGYDYWECGVCKLCKDENCFEYAQYLCQLDFLLVELMGIRLKRTGTLALQNEKCDFRFYKK